MELGAIFDWDGVVINSSRHHDESWVMLAKEIGKTLPGDHFERGFGMKNEEIIPNIMGWTQDAAEVKQLSLRKEALYRVCLNRDGLEVLPGVRTFLTMLREHAIPCVIGSSTHRLNIETGMRLAQIGEFFSGMITSESVTLGKPDPQVFLLAAQFISRRPSQCIVFEDVPAGIEAGKRGGMKVVAVTTTHPRDRLGLADLVVDRLDEITYETYEALVRG